MGQNCCQPKSFPLNPIEWQEVETLQDKKRWRNTISGEEIEEYFIRARDSQDLQRHIDFFNLRADHQYLVSAKYITIEDDNSLCCSQTNGRLFLEKTISRLTNLGHLSLPSILYIYYNAFSGFKQLSSHCGYFVVQQEMICTNQANLIKIWMNSDLSKSIPQTIHLRLEEQMVRSIVECINTKYHQIMPTNIEEFFKSRAVKTFDQAILTLKQYATLHNIVIAVNGLNFSDLEQKVSQQIKNYSYTLIEQKQIKTPKILQVQNVAMIPVSNIFTDSRPRRQSFIQQAPIHKQLIPPLPPTIKKLPPAPHSVRKNQQIVRKSIVGDKFIKHPLKKQYQTIRHKSVMPIRRSIVNSQIPQMQKPLTKININNPMVINNHLDIKKQVNISQTPIMWKTSDGHTCQYIWDIIKLGRQEQVYEQCLNTHQVNLEQSKHRQLSTVPSNTTRSFSSLNISKRFSQTQLRSRGQSIQKNTLYNNPYTNFSRFGNLIEECRHQQQEQSSPTEVPGRKHHDAEHTPSRLFHLIRSNFGQKRIEQRSYSSEPYTVNTHTLSFKQDQNAIDNNIQPIVHSLNIVPISSSTSIRSSGLQFFSKATGRTSAAATEISQSNPYLQNSNHEPSISASPIKNFSIQQSTNYIDSPDSKYQQEEIRNIYRSDPEISVKTSMQNESNSALSNIQQSLIIERQLQQI